MKQSRTRRHLRPRLTRSQVHHQIARLRTPLQLYQSEWMAEAAKAQPSQRHLQCLQESIKSTKEELDMLETHQ
jgi:hypothetical protein